MADSVNVRVSDSDKLYPNAVVVKVGTQEIIAGRDGVSPVVTTEAIPHGNRVTITDAVGEHAFDVMDGASAYEQAVAGGYEGTEAEFAEDLAGFSDKADTAETAAASAAQSAQSAINSASNAATEAGEAAASAATALTHRDAADSSAQSAAASATSAGNSASAAAASASAANGSATSASASESNAANSATNAASSETAAAASESAAAASAAAASNSAAAAAQSASAIEEYEHDAEAWAIGKRGGTDVDSSDATYQNNSKYYAEQAAASSSAASSAASAAAQSATEAASEADSSKSYSRSSYISSTMASGSATAAADAQTAAETAAATAEGHATNAASSATAASGSATAAATSESNAADSAAAAAASEAEAKRVEESIPADYTDLAEDVSNLKSAVNDPVTGLDTKAPVIINSASGNIAGFADGANGVPVKQLTVNVEPIQAGSGDPSPDNVRPISGRTSATIYHSGADTSDPSTYIIQIGESVYGGKLNVSEGKLAVDRRFIVADGVNIRVIGGYGAPGPKWLPCIVLSGDNKAYNDTSTIISSYLQHDAGFQNIENSIGVGNGGAAIILHIGAMQGTDGTHGYNSASEVWAAVNAYLQEHPLQICYTLAAPAIEIALTPTQISTMLGSNNIWSDSGDVSVDYCADTKLYIDNIHTPTDDDMTADTQIASGKYFLIGGALYKSTTVIPAGDTIRPGTNCVQTNLAEALNALNA